MKTLIRDRRQAIIIGLGLGSLAFWGVLRFFPASTFSGADGEARSAAEIMAEGLETLGACREASGPAIDLRADPNRTGLIGVEESAITTSLGQLEAKRTTTNPNFAAALVRLFEEAGVRRGDTVAVGASSSFPGLILATLAAAKAIDLRPLLIVSLGASNWGANIPSWTWLEIGECLHRGGVLDVRPLACSVGGEGDEGVDMSPEGRELLRTKAERLGIPLVLEPDLASDVRQRLEIFDRAASGAPIKAFVNVGGSWVNLGTDAAILELKPGVNREMRIPPLEKRGLIQEMALRKIPIIHLLFVKGLAERFGLPWDPVPLPHPGEGFLAAGKSRRIGRTVASLIYLAGVFAGLAWFGAAQARLRASM